MNGEIARELIVAGLIAAFGSAAMIPVLMWESRRIRARFHEWSNIMSAHIGAEELERMGKGHLIGRGKRD